ncbi:MAG: protein kinase domain-containing protein [Dolichospermum sp.]|jgi:serine/threonine protein kinase
MSQCLNPDCLQQNPQKTIFCQRCGSKLVLQERYRGVRVIGEGGFGRTFLAVDEQRLDTPCVIKQFLPQQSGSGALEKATELFKQEAVRLRDLGKHSHIPDLLAFFPQEGRLYLIQEFLEGKNLLDELEEKGKFSESEVKQILVELLPILQFVHDNKVIHRDIKPENIIRSSQTGALFLIDFGVSKEVGGSVLTRVGTITGTLGYAPPEQMRGKVFPNSDLYSLAVTCIRLLTGYFQKDDGDDLIFDSMRMQWIWKQYVSVSQELEIVLDKMLQDLPINRFQSANEVLSVLEEQEVTTSQIPVSSNPSIKLISSIGVDYRELDRLLASGKWKAADRETAKVMLKATNRELEGWLCVENIDNFPCEDLRIIDDLWVRYSKGRFGFSVQKRIYQSLVGTNEPDAKSSLAFVNALGWVKGVNKIVHDFNIVFNMTAPEGHLPSIMLVPRLGGWGLGWGDLARYGKLNSMFSLILRLTECQR